MNYWTDKHESLLNALQSESLIPDLFRRLSGERLEATEKDVRVLRDWSASIQNDPGWKFLGPVATEPEAFPAVFDDAVDAGFSARTDHHHALVFGTMCERFIEAQSFDHALTAWRRCFDAWSRVYRGTYIDDLVADLETTLNEAERREIIDQTLATYASTLVGKLDDPAGHASQRVHREQLRFFWLANQDLTEETGDSNAVAELRAQGSRELSELDTKLTGKLERAFDQIDPTDPDADEDIIALMVWYSDVYSVIGFTDSGVSSLVPTVVEWFWDLRRVGRDDADVFKKVLSIAKPFNVALHEKIKTGSLFGLNSKCADFLVFEGEQQTDPAARRTTFETGLEICPGHRNSAMLLSYVWLSEIDAIILKLQLIPKARMMVRWGTSSIDDMFRDGWALVDKVEDVYPFNERFETVSANLDAEASRLGVTRESI